MTEQVEKIKCLIIGSGPAGYTAAIYAARAELSPVVYEGLEPGGQLTTTTEIDNFPGYPNGTAGVQMMEDLKNQAKRFDTDVRSGFVTKVDFSSRPFKLTVDSSKNIEAETVIIATGATAKWLGIESEQRMRGLGVSACATCDGFFYKGQDVVVVGGGDTAAEDATYLSKLCKKVYLIHRRDELRASKAMQKRVMDTPNIEMVWDSSLKEVLGENEVTGVLLQNIKTNEDLKIEVTGVFIAIGHHPNSDVFKEQINVDEDGYIITAPDSTRTNIEGVFAAGDIQDKTFRQAITAAGSGCMAAIETERFLSE